MAGSSRAYRLYQKHTIEELAKMNRQIGDDPTSHNPQHDPTHQDPRRNSIQIYTPAARAKMSDIAQAITWHLQDALDARRKAEGVGP